MNGLHGKTDVRDLKIPNIPASRRIKMRNIYAYEFRTLCFNANPRSCSLADTLPLGLQIQRRVQGKALWGSTAVGVHGFCSIDLEKWASRYRILSQCEAGSSLSLGVFAAGGQIDSGRCQRDPRLETLGGSCQRAYQTSQKTLSGREPWIGFGKRGLRSGFLNHRSHDVDVPLGEIPFNKKRYQNSHFVGFKGPDSCLHLHFRRQARGCQLLGRIDFRAWSFLHHGQGVYRLVETVSNRQRRGILCDSRQGQSTIYEIQVATSGQIDRIAQRPNRETLDSQVQRRFPHPYKEDSLLRRRKEQALNIFDEQLADTRISRGQTLQKALGDRIVFQMDQRQSGNQALLWNKPQRGEDANLDSRLAVFDGGDPAQEFKIARKPSQHSADFERAPV